MSISSNTQGSQKLKQPSKGFWQEARENGLTQLQAKEAIRSLPPIEITESPTKDESD